MSKLCYMCDSPATTREHFPPKCLFPRKANLQLATVPSCRKHNNAKSEDDQYFLAQILMNAASADNLPKRKFMEAIRPHLERSRKFRELISDGSLSLDDGRRAYSVNVARMNNVMDGICHAIYYTRFKRHLDSKQFNISHEFMNFLSEDTTRRRFVQDLMGAMIDLFEEFSWMVECHEADKVDEVVYSYRIADKFGPDASITVLHSFYGSFNVISLLTRKLTIASVDDIRSQSSKCEAIG